MYFCKSLSLIALSFLSCSPLALANDQSVILGKLPSNSEMVVYTPDINELVAEIAVYAGKFEADADDISLANLCKKLAEQWQLGQELVLDESKPAALAFTSLMAADKSWLLYLPVKDKQAFLDGIPAEKKLESGVYRFTDMSYMTSVEDYLLFGANEFNLNTAIKGNVGFETLASTLSDMEQSDITIYADLTNVMNVGRLMVPAALMNVPDLQSNPDLASRVQKMIMAGTEINRISWSIDFQEAGIVTHSNISVLSGGELARHIKDYNKLNFSDMASLPDGEMTYVSGISVSPEMVKCYFNSVFDLAAVAAPHYRTPEMQKCMSNISTLVNTVFDNYGAEMGPVVAANYLAAKEGLSPDKRVMSVSATDIKPEVIDSIWKVFVESDLSPMVNIRSVEFEAGVIGDCPYSTIFYTLNQPVAENSYLNTDLDVYFGRTVDNLMVQALDKDAFSEVVSLASSEKKLTDSVLYKKATDMLPSSANLYFVADVNNLVDNFIATYNLQAGQIAEKQPEMALPLAFVGPAINAAESLDGIAGLSVEINDGFIRYNCFCDQEAIDSVVSTVEKMKELSGNNGGPGQGGQDPVSEL
ncbi:MAG: hypothetical protein JW745_09235 [Sedimentisphaerales bacterium]|nr:hypothetical protein [Sedimentisphaerales bacterium]MBN2842348.1 hypothetical protein [Sedimentisphaerales bacterium]